MRVAIISIFLLPFAQPTLAKENYICFLDRFMEVGNDGVFFWT